MKKKFEIDTQTKIILLLTLVGMTVFLVNFFLAGSSMLINLFSVAIVVVGPLTIEYNKYKEKKEVEERFPDFLRDITQNIKTGMTLTQAIKATKKTYYAALTPHVKTIIVKIDWGIPFDKILKDFSKNSTPLIKKTVSTILETYRGGGDITQILESAGRTIREINRVRKERSSGIYSQMVTGYVIFFIFIAILIIFKNYLLEELIGFVSGGLVGIDYETLQQIYSNAFQWLILIEGLFSGIIVGKMAEGSMVAGLKHAFILLLIGYGAYLFLL
jgi:flagellar protein FlaJ